MKRLFLAALLAAALSGCTGFKEDIQNNFISAPLLGMLYTEKGLAADGVQVFMDGSAAAVSDINGRFVIPDVPAGKHVFTFRKEGMETLVTDLDFLNPAQILYASMISMEEILENLEQSLKGNRLEEAGELVKRGRAVEKHDPRLEYLTVVYLVKTGSYAAASRKIEELIKRFPENRILAATEKEILSVKAEYNSEEGADQ